MSCVVATFTASRNGNPNLRDMSPLSRCSRVELGGGQTVEPRARLLADRRVAHPRPCAQIGMRAQQRQLLLLRCAARTSCTIAPCKSSRVAERTVRPGPLGHPRRVLEDPSQGFDEPPRSLAFSSAMVMTRRPFGK